MSNDAEACRVSGEAETRRMNVEQARAILLANDRGGYCVPTARLYPFQWNWDSAFVAMGWGTFDEARAWQEITSLLKGQWEDGLIPQIVFHAPSDDYFPGPDVWGVRRTPATSGITQPPVLATAVRHLWDTGRDRALAEANAASIYPALVRNHRWWQAARDPERRGLVATLHPWETGMDNSPAWDAALARVPMDTVTPIRRRDTAHVDAAMRPRGEEYQRFIHLVDVYRDAGWDPARMLAASPFRVADVATNAILLRAEQDLLAMAGRFGTDTERAEIEERVARLHTALERLWHDGLGLYASMDLMTHEIISVGTSGGFLPLFAGHARDRAATLAATLARWAARVSRVVPSTDPGFTGFEPKRYWRGPIWAVVNWMIADGFRATGDAATADRIRGDTVALIEAAGPSEYFDPVTGEGIGGADFSWTASIFLLWVR
jgi:glycogen debranching enzyme